MMSSKNGIRQIIETCVTVVTLIALTRSFRVIKATLNDLFGLARWTRDAVWPAQLADGRTFQLGEGWHSSRNTVRFWAPFKIGQK